MGVWDRQFFLGGLVAFWLAVGAAVLVHELGHFVAGRLMGFSLQFLQVGPLALGYDHGNLRIQYQPNWGVSGLKAMHVSGILRLRRKLLVYVAAGPLTNHLFVFFGGGVTRNVAADLNIFFWSAIQLFSAACLLAFFGSVIPYRSANGFFSDGARLRMLLLPNVETKRWYAIIGWECSVGMVDNLVSGTDGGSRSQVLLSDRRSSPWWANFCLTPLPTTAKTKLQRANCWSRASAMLAPLVNPSATL